MAESIGQRLKLARESKQLSIEEAAFATRIKPHYLRALEADDMAALPSPVQGRGFLRMYVEFLQLSTAEQPILPNLSTTPAITAEAEAQGELREEADAANPQISKVFVSSADTLPEPSPALSPSQAILAEIGLTLRRRREALSLSLENVEKLTHLRLNYLNALEAGRLDLLPSPVQGRGMLNNYALFLNLDAEKILLRYADALQTQRLERLGNRPGRKSNLTTIQKSRSGRFFTTDAILTSVLILAMLGFVFWATATLLDMQQGKNIQPALPEVSDILSGSTPSLQPTGSLPPELTATIDENGETPQVETPEPGTTLEEAEATQPQVVGQGSIQISIIPLLRAWVRVTVDEKVIFTGRVLPGNAYTYAGSERVEVLCGNGAAIRLLYNQADLGALGTVGQVINLIFTPEGQILPTPTITPIPTAVPQVTPTPAPSGPSPTPNPSQTPAN